MPSKSPPFDILIIGAGIVGLATAARLLEQHPELRVGVLEKEAAVGCHQSGRNSGVIHSGVYYRPDSLKARLCRQGRELLLQFCQTQGLPHEICGKVIVAVEERELEALAELERRAADNRVSVEVLNERQLRDLEPHARGMRALHVPAAGIVDFKAVTRRLAERVTAHGSGSLQLDAQVHAVASAHQLVAVETDCGRFHARFVVNAAGLQADRVAHLCGQRPRARIVPFRGDYFTLREDATRLVRNLIYPVPQPGLPFLGVHATRTVSGDVECGPNASLALGREAYAKFQVQPEDLTDALSYSGVWKLLRRHPTDAAREWWQSFSRRAFLSALQRLLPDVTLEQLLPRAAGIRAQALAPDGTLIDDFMLLESERVLSVVNAPSPAATSSFAIAETVARRVLARSGS